MEEKTWWLRRWNGNDEAMYRKRMGLGLGFLGSSLIFF